MPAAARHETLPATQPVLQLVPAVRESAPVPALTDARAAVASASTLAERLAAPLPEREALADARASKKQKSKRRIAPGELHLVVAPDGATEILALYDPETGALQIEALHRFAELLGCADATGVEPRLAAILTLIGRDFDRPVHLVSGQREPEAASGHARGHAHGNAVDIYVPGISTRALRDHLHANFENVGVGYRPRAGHVHLDVRAVTLHWTDTARPGQQGRERLELPPPTAASDPTLASVHLPPEQLVATREAPRDSKRVEPSATPTGGKKSAAGKGGKGKKGGAKFHTVKAGETVGAIARKYGVSSAKIIEWNKLDGEARIRKGQKLRVRK